jgi:hypothetical protein
VLATVDGNSCNHVPGQQSRSIICRIECASPFSRVVCRFALLEGWCCGR